MPTLLDPAAHLEGLRAAMVAFVRYADRAGLAAPVPTCPGWTVRDLVAHQGMVHRWAADLLGGRARDEVDPASYEQEGREAADPLEWLRDGAVAVARTMSTAHDRTTAPVFLPDAPAPRAFWARRQCHEATVHAVDALGAALGRAPRPEETWIEPALALDGIDEHLGGFLARPRSRLRCAEEQVLVVAPDDAADWWEVSIGPHPCLTTRRTGPVGDGDWELGGSAVDLYLQLWNRTPRPPAPRGPVREPVEELVEESVEEFRRLTAVRWRP